MYQSPSFPGDCMKVPRSFVSGPAHDAFLEKLDWTRLAESDAEPHAAWSRGTHSADNSNGFDWVGPMIVRIAQYPLGTRLLFGIASGAGVFVAQQAPTMVANGRLTFLLISASLPMITVLFGACRASSFWRPEIAFGSLWMNRRGVLMRRKSACMAYPLLNDSPTLS